MFVFLALVDAARNGVCFPEVSQSPCSHLHQRPENHCFWEFFVFFPQTCLIYVYEDSSGLFVTSQPKSHWFNPRNRNRYVGVSLGKTLNPTLPPVCSSVCDCAYEKEKAVPWLNGKIYLYRSLLTKRVQSECVCGQVNFTCGVKHFEWSIRRENHYKNAII